MSLIKDFSISALVAGFVTVLVGFTSSAVIVFPAAHAFGATPAGLALLGTIGNGLAIAMSHEKEREPALVTFLVTASGVSLLGIGSAFRGLLAGALALVVSRAGRRHLAGLAAHFAIKRR